MKANMWYQSAEMAEFINNELTFEVTEEQKEYMQKHMDEVYEKLDAVKRIDFEPFWNGVEDCFICTAYI